MMACLSDRVLWALSEEDGTAEEFLHLRHCRLCAVRADRLAAELHAIAGVLCDEPPPLASPEPARRPLLRAAMAAVLLAAIGMAVFAHRQTPVALIAPGDGFAALSEVSSDVFDDEEPLGTPTETDVVVAGLSAAAPCEWQAAGCQDIGQPLF
jgi:hypothetical protein